MLPLVEDDFKKLHEEIDNDEDDEEGAMNSDVFMKTSFKKDSENPDRPRTHKEIMMEVIMNFVVECRLSRRTSSIASNVEWRRRLWRRRSKTWMR